MEFQMIRKLIQYSLLILSVNQMHAKTCPEAFEKPYNPQHKKECFEDLISRYQKLPSLELLGMIERWNHSVFLEFISTTVFPHPSPKAPVAFVLQRYVDVAIQESRKTSQSKEITPQLTKEITTLKRVFCENPSNMLLDEALKKYIHQYPKAWVSVKSINMNCEFRQLKLLQQEKDPDVLNYLVKLSQNAPDEKTKSLANQILDNNVLH